MLDDDSPFCYRAPFNQTYGKNPVYMFSHFKYKNYCGSAYFNIMSWLYSHVQKFILMTHKSA